MFFQRTKNNMPVWFSVPAAVQGHMAGCLYSEEDRADSRTQGLCLHTLRHTHPPLHTAEIEGLTMFSISNTNCECKGLAGDVYRIYNIHFFQDGLLCQVG